MILQSHHTLTNITYNVHRYLFCSRTAEISSNFAFNLKAHQYQQLTNSRSLSLFLFQKYILFIYNQIMAQPAPYYPNNQQATYGAYDYSSAINPNIPSSSGIRGNYEPARASSFISSPATRITFKQPGGAVSTSKVINNQVGYTPNIQPQISPTIVNTSNPQTVNLSRTEVVEHPIQVRTSTVQQAAPQASSNIGGAHMNYAIPSAKPVEDHYPKWQWPTVALLGVLFLTLSLLWGLGVFGGTKIVTLPATTVSAASPKSSSKQSASSPVTSPSSKSPSTNNFSAVPTVAAPSGTTSTPAPPPAPSRIYPASIPAQTIAPIQVKPSNTAASSPPTQPTTTTTTTQPTTSSPPTQPTYTNSIPASVAPMTASSTTPLTTTTTTQVTTIHPSSITPTTATTQQTSTTNATTQPTSTTTATTQPTSLTEGTQPTTTVATTVATKPA